MFNKIVPSIVLALSVLQAQTGNINVNATIPEEWSFSIPADVELQPTGQKNAGLELYDSDFQITVRGNIANNHYVQMNVSEVSLRGENDLTPVLEHNEDRYTWDYKDCLSEEASLCSISSWLEPSNYIGNFVVNMSLLKTSNAGIYSDDGTMTYSWEQLEDKNIFTVTDGVLSSNVYLDFSSDEGYEQSGLPEEDNQLLTGTLILPDTITSISDYCFLKATNLINVVLPDTLQSIGEEAFSECASLTSIDIPDSVQNIGNGTFLGCTLLTSISIPNCESIGSYTFSFTALTAVDIPDSVQSIGEGAFSGCASLAAVKLSNNIQNIGNYAFLQSEKLENVSYKGTTYTYVETLENALSADNVTLGRNVFEDTLLEENVPTLSWDELVSQEYLYINDGILSSRAKVTSDNGEICFENESAEYIRGDIEIPSTITSLAKGVFGKCYYITSVTLPNTITTIGYAAFYDCFKNTALENNGVSFF